MELKLNDDTLMKKTQLVLIVPFMELKLIISDAISIIICLNRTFYGIETEVDTLFTKDFPVLIVPFMELKH